MQHELTFQFTRRFIFDSLKRDLAQRTVKAVLGVAAISFGITLVTRGTEGMTLGLVIWLLFATLVLCALMTWTLRRAVSRVWELWSKQSPAQEMRFVADDEGFAVQMESGQNRYAWDRIRRLWRHHDVWLLEIVQNTSVPFPCREATAEFRDFVVTKCQSAGVKT